MESDIKEKSTGEIVLARFFQWIIGLCIATIGVMLIVVGLHDFNVLTGFTPGFWSILVILFGIDLAVHPWVSWIQALPRLRAEDQRILSK